MQAPQAPQAPQAQCRLVPTNVTTNLIVNRDVHRSTMHESAER